MSKNALRYKPRGRVEARTDDPRSEKRAYPGARNGENGSGNFSKGVSADPFGNGFKPDGSFILESDRDKMCSSKRKYTKREAETVMNAFRRHRGSHGRPESLRSYVCPFCNGWHLTKDKSE